MNKNFNEMKELFINPPTEYNPVTMWFWNSTITKEGITKQMEEFCEQGVYEFYIHPACYAEFEYLSDQYMDLIRYVVTEAKRLGMKYWIYDEFEYPSGTAGGLLSRDYPELRQKRIICVPIDAQAAAYCWNVNLKGDFICAQRLSIKKGEYYAADATDLCEVVKTGEFVDVTLRNHYVNNTMVLLYFSTFVPSGPPSMTTRPGMEAHRGYVDMMSYEAVSKFIELTHERYKAHIGDEFGKTVMGVFTDEPTTLCPHCGADPYIRNAIGPWNDKFAEEFEKRNGYSIYPHLHSLIYKPLSPIDHKVKNDYRETVRDLYHRNFCGQIAEWCQNNNLKFTGHYPGEEELGGYIAQGDMQMGLSYMDEPGMDSIWCANKIDDNNFCVAGKVVAGAAKVNGKNRILCEDYTCSFYNFKLPVMKRNANKLLIMGANKLQYMGAWYAIDNKNRWPGPPYSYQNTQYKHFGKYNNYLASLQALSANTTPDSRVLMLIPMGQATAEYGIYDDSLFRQTPYYGVRPEYQRFYEDTINALLLEGISFDLISESYVDKMTVSGDEIKMGEYSYDTIVLPWTETVNSGTARILEAVKGTGVKVVFAQSLPKTVYDKAEGKEYEVSLGAYREAEDIKVYSDENVYLIKAESLPVNMAAYRKLAAEIIGHKALNIESAGKTYIGVRSNADCEVYFIANDTEENAEITFDLLPGMEIFNAETKAKYPYSIKDGRATVKLDGCEMIVAIRDKKSTAVAEPEAECRTSVCEQVTVDKYKFSLASDNELVLKYEAYDKEDDMWLKCEHGLINDGVYLQVNEVYNVRSSFTVDKIPEKLFVHAETRKINKLVINGSEVKLPVNIRTWTDYESKVEITDLVKTGENIVEMECTAICVPYRLAIPFVMITGKFGLDENDVITDMPAEIDGSGWEKQGFTYYSGDATYAFDYVVTRDFKKADIQFTTDDIATVYVNGEGVDCRMWAPYSVDVTKQLKKGVNKIEICVTSSLGNRFMKTRNPARNGLFAPTKITLRA